MNKQTLICASIGAIAATVSVFDATVAHAYRFSSDLGRAEADYMSQFDDGDHFLSFDLWNKFNSAYVNKERQALPLNEITPLKASDLDWAAGARGVEVFFINEGASYRNKLHFSTDGTRNRSSMTTIFSDIASQKSVLSERNGPLAVGEGRILGDLSEGSILSFWLENGPGQIFGSVASENPDYSPTGFHGEHLNVFKSDGFLILAYEDLFRGGDRDYNDVVIAVRGLRETEADAEAVPEPSSMMGLLGVAAVAWRMLRRRTMAAG